MGTEEERDCVFCLNCFSFLGKKGPSLPFHEDMIFCYYVKISKIEHTATQLKGGD